ncbi:GNAT family N-acetyltransferase [Undibacterium fentianense]|uniref:GNAT family N-acetyltransferase n=1 Tax=Undibacterium fentianense TaxID=2828728 RepID=A0A941DX66_9BURK|nr:GNAT family protein [Undibacterium fentianense]MBR7799044.1 GNAT family N-acetyltransferase [Undibacterium fentianense]
MPIQSLRQLAINPFQGHPLPSLSIPNLCLRLIKDDDLPDWYDYLRLPETRLNMSWDVKSPWDLQQFTQVQDWSNPNAQLKLAICDTNTQKLIGTIGLHSISTQHMSGEVAYDLNPAYWGHGIMRVACASITHWAHDEIGFERIQALVMDSNLASASVLQYCGFSLEGLLRRYRKVRGCFRDYYIYSHLH